MILIVKNRPNRHLAAASFGSPTGAAASVDRGCGQRAGRTSAARPEMIRPPVRYHSMVTAAVVIPAPTEQRISLSPRESVSWTSVMARGMLALEVLPTRSTFR